jgi:pteridine reductase
VPTADPTLQRSLHGKVALVTGGAVRLGRAIALGLAARGASVAFSWHRSSAQAEAALSELAAVASRAGASALSVRCDVTEEGDVDELFRRVDERFGRLDLLVNNAAIFERTPFPDVTSEAWRRHLDVNLTGPFLCAKRAGDRMLSGDGGVIVNVACAGGVRPWANYVAYCVSKAGLVMMTQVLAKALAPSVRVNAVAPGPVLMPESYDEAQRAAAVRRTVLERAGSPADVVRAVLFCWDSEYTTGALIPVEGGRLVL